MFGNRLTAYLAGSRVRPARSWVFLALAAQLICAAGADAQESPAKVNLGSTTATPGSPAEISVTLYGNDPAGIGSVAARISFPLEALSFKDSEAGLASLLAEAEIRARLLEGENDSGISTLEISVSGGKPLRPGTLMILEFGVSPTVAVGPIQLEAPPADATTAEGAPLRLAKGEDGAVSVMEEQVNPTHLTCFFFAH